MKIRQYLIKRPSNKEPIWLEFMAIPIHNIPNIKAPQMAMLWILDNLTFCLIKKPI
nr:hypothetical protein [Dysgonomonas macrotermitis]